MKKPIFKILSIATLILAVSITSCKDAEITDVKKETEVVVELKITTPQPSPLGKISQRVG